MAASAHQYQSAGRTGRGQGPSEDRYGHEDGSSAGVPDPDPNIEDKLDNPGEPKVLNDKLPGGSDHSWKCLRVHKDKLYWPIGAPCNICDPGECAKIYRMNLDGSNIETVASGLRNTDGFDFSSCSAKAGATTKR